MATVDGALARHGKPSIFTKNQASKFTPAAFTDMLGKAEIARNMNACVARRDNVFVKRIWRTMSYEKVYLRAHDSVSEARASIGR